jgi:hypothetical protein
VKGSSYALGRGLVEVIENRGGGLSALKLSCTLYGAKGEAPEFAWKWRPAPGALKMMRGRESAETLSCINDHLRFDRLKALDMAASTSLRETKEKGDRGPQEI